MCPDFNTLTIKASTYRATGFFRIQASRPRSVRTTQREVRSVISIE
jgi:hypothetical protein